MVRPCFLVVDREHAGSISTRKLVIETAKFNVITSYSGAEAIETLRTYPAVDGVVMDAILPDMDCCDLVRALKSVRPGLPVVVVSSPRARTMCTEGDHVLESFEPARLIDLLQKLLPTAAAAIQQQEIHLEQVAARQSPQ